MMGERAVKWRIGFLPDHRHAATWTVTLLLVALALPVAESLWRSGAGKAPVFVFSIVLALVWETVFAYALRRAVNADFLVAALVFAILAPVSAPYWQLGMGASFAYVVGVHIFGGHGWTFLSHSTVAFAFLIFAFPASGFGSLAIPSWPMVVPGALLLFFFGVVSWRTAIVTLGALAVALGVLRGFNWSTSTIAAQFVFPVLFLACDPCASPTTAAARWTFGVFVGGLAGLLLASGKPAAEAAFSAILLGSLIAPLLDYAAVQWHVYRRGLRRG